MSFTWDISGIFEARKIMLGEMQSPIDLYCVIDALSVGKACRSTCLENASRVFLGGASSVASSADLFKEPFFDLV